MKRLTDAQLKALSAAVDIVTTDPDQWWSAERTRVMQTMQRAQAVIDDELDARAVARMQRQVPKGA